MNNMTKWLVLLALTIAPLSAAHINMVGAPKQHCEVPLVDTTLHEYGPPSTGFVIFLGLDGSIPPCPYGDTTWDGHIEYAHGGAWLQAAASVCTEAYPDHAPGSVVSVYDAVLTELGSDVAFSVYADTINNDPVPSEPNCGDFESDYGVDCVNQCAPGFPPGLDGSYQVYVSGTTGHIYHGPQPPTTTSPKGHITIHNWGQGPKLLASPPGWTCGTLTTVGSVTSISCTPPDATPLCGQVGAYGYGANVGGTGTMSITSSCVGLSTTAGPIPLPGPTVASGASGFGSFPWTCSVDFQQTGGVTIDWWAHCTVN